ncbi:putative SMC domain-containing protein [Salmonella phage SPAsTU]|nr:putative SMC domain-containing protein [Salmonella phage STsAS]AWN09152.2 putative SMC domain-containing protein [Salmonella phage SPAsTU]
MLKVERIILKGFTGMGLHEIETFDFTLKSLVTIILGGNGCGKTSLLSVFLPLAPAKSEFREGGSYTNFCVVGDDRFKFEVLRRGSSLSCTIENLSKGTIVVNAVNSKVYNSMVEQLTGITKEIKELINGEVLLTDASTEVRRKWFTLMSASDLTYAVGLYRKLRKHASSLNGAVEHVGKKIAEAKMRVVEDEADKTRLEERLVELDRELQDLNKQIESRNRLDNSVSLDSIQRRLNALQPAVKLIMERQGALPDDVMIDAQKRVEMVWREQAASAETEVVMLNKELSHLLDEETRQDYLMRNHTGLKETIERLKEEIAAFDSQQWLFPELFEGTRITADMIAAASADARNWNLPLTQHLDQVKSPERLGVLEKKLLQMDALSAGLAERRQRCENVLHGLYHERQHFMDTSEVDCPKCNFRFRPGVRKSLQEIEKAINDNEDWKRQLVAELEGLMRDRKEVEEDVSSLRVIREIIMTYSKDPVLGLFFRKLQERDVFTTNRHLYGSLAAMFGQELEAAPRCLRQREQLITAEREWANAVAAIGNVDGALGQKIAHVRQRLDAAQANQTTARNEANAVARQIDYLTKTKQAIEQFQTNFGLLTADMGTSLNNVVVRNLLQQREGKLDAYTSARERFRQMESAIARLGELEKEQDELMNEHQHTKLIINALSPEKGILRRYFYLAIMRITDLMNHYIELVWSYSMQVIPCDLTEGDMDYTFPVRLKDHDELVPDVKKGSKAQRIIFNMMFRLTAYKALGLQQYPLLLDEPSEGMDEEHRNRLVGFIKSLANSGEFSQLLVVSHEAEVHSKLNEATYCVIEPEGVTLPAVYNEGVKIKYADAA